MEATRMKANLAEFDLAHAALKRAKAKAAKMNATLAEKLEFMRPAKERYAAAQAKVYGDAA